MQQSAQLLETLDRLIQALSASGESHWRKYVADCRSKIAAGHEAGVTKLLGAYGGMGSLNDVVGSTEELDRTLRSLAAEGYDLARALQRSSHAGGA